MPDKVTIIAEIGVNHNGSVEMAEEMISLAAAAGADVVKFQTFKPELVISQYAQKAEYQRASTGAAESQLEMVRKYELDFAAHQRLFQKCKEEGVVFLSTPFDIPSVELLLSLGVSQFKIPSGEITNAPLLYRVARTGLPVILSTGMSTLEEVRTALGILALGYADSQIRQGDPSLTAAENIYFQPEGQQQLKNNVSLLHCTTQYPAPLKDVNLCCMDTLRDTFGLPVGYSDHTEGMIASVAAVARGAVIIEKHFTLDKSLPGPDQQASINPDELRELVRSIREVELLLGSAEKRVTASEELNRTVARKSLTALCAIAKGSAFTSENLGTKRPGMGISALHYWEYIGRVADRDYAEDEIIKPCRLIN
ncbi:MAG: N-acetylneuraminate synthase [Synergistaceae bacterium]|nr:N-acetylneuraminate synthase [Synergistaceae bacterium]MBP9626026.1 N-acetylneuraminate synthase [Synergistaceae bacterium]MBP9957357.1 N-acetylneuraminate synthase [Synergistaceae bacterium]